MYLVDYFFTSMSSTQRSEGMKNIVKMKIKSYFTVMEFMTKYERVIAMMHEKENARVMMVFMLRKKP